MSKKYLSSVPKTLQEDFIDNRVLPIVGAGFSKNGILPTNMQMPDWNQLGKNIAEYINDYEYVNAIDALSLFECEFSRAKLVEMIARELYVNEAKPGKAHRAFCSILFDTICTTNFDFLLDYALSESNRPFSTIVSEDRLPISIHEKTKLIKLHGDFNHPDRMVITEKDYDLYLDKNKILSTFVSNLFITKTLLLVGYSFDDIDIRGLWQIINSRLGHLNRPAYVVILDATPIEISRFERRNIKVINLHGRRPDYPSILTEFFSEIKELIDEKAPQRLVATNEKAVEELLFPRDDNRLCFISAPFHRISFLKKVLYPILYRYDITPISADETLVPGDNLMLKTDILLKKSFMAIVDLSGNSENIVWELDVILQHKKKLILIAEDNKFLNLPNAFDDSVQYLLKYYTDEDNEEFVISFENAISRIINQNNIEIEKEPQRLLRKSEYDAAIISAFRMLESFLRGRFSDNYERPMPLNQILRNLRDSSIPKHVIDKVVEYSVIRNKIVHTNTPSNRRLAIEIVSVINELISIIKQEEIYINTYVENSTLKRHD